MSGIYQIGALLLVVASVNSCGKLDADWIAAVQAVETLERLVCGVDGEWGRYILVARVAVVKQLHEQLFHEANVGYLTLRETLRNITTSAASAASFVRTGSVVSVSTKFQFQWLSTKVGLHGAAFQLATSVDTLSLSHVLKVLGVPVEQGALRPVVQTASTYFDLDMYVWKATVDVNLERGYCYLKAAFAEALVSKLRAWPTIRDILDAGFKLHALMWCVAVAPGKWHIVVGDQLLSARDVGARGLRRVSELSVLDRLGGDVDEGVDDDMVVRCYPGVVRRHSSGIGPFTCQQYCESDVCEHNLECAGREGWVRRSRASFVEEARFLGPTRAIPPLSGGRVQCEPSVNFLAYPDVVTTRTLKRSTFVIPDHQVEFLAGVMWGVVATDDVVADDNVLRLSDLSSSRLVVGALPLVVSDVLTSDDLRESDHYSVASHDVDAVYEAFVVAEVNLRLRSLFHGSVRFKPYDSSRKDNRESAPVRYGLSVKVGGVVMTPAFFQYIVGDVMPARCTLRSSAFMCAVVADPRVTRVNGNRVAKDELPVVVCDFALDAVLAIEVVASGADSVFFWLVEECGDSSLSDIMQSSVLFEHLFTAVYSID